MPPGSGPGSIRSFHGSPGASVLALSQVFTGSPPRVVRRVVTVNGAPARQREVTSMFSPGISPREKWGRLRLRPSGASGAPSSVTRNEPALWILARAVWGPHASTSTTPVSPMPAARDTTRSACSVRGRGSWAVATTPSWSRAEGERDPPALLQTQDVEVAHPVTGQEAAVRDEVHVLDDDRLGIQEMQAPPSPESPAACRPASACGPARHPRDRSEISTVLHRRRSAHHGVPGVVVLAGVERRAVEDDVAVV